MNPIAKKQLDACKVADLPYYDEKSTLLVIPKKDSNRVNEFHLHKYFIVELADYIINPPPDYTLSANWNRGSVPRYKYMKVEICQLMGKMIRINGAAFDPNTNTDIPYVWEGWVPSQGLKIVKRLS